MVYTSDVGTGNLYRSHLGAMSTEATLLNTAEGSMVQYSSLLNRVYVSSERIVNDAPGFTEHDGDTLAHLSRTTVAQPGDANYADMNSRRAPVIVVSDPQQKIFALSGSGHLAAFDLSTKTRLFYVDVSSRNTPVQSVGSMVVDEVHNELYVATPGFAPSMSVYSTQTGTYLRTISVGAGKAMTLALNRVTQKLYVTRVDQPPVILDVVTGQVDPVVGVTEEARAVAVNSVTNDVFFVADDAKNIYKIAGAIGSGPSSLIAKIQIPQVVRGENGDDIWAGNYYWAAGAVNEATGMYVFMGNDLQLYSLANTPY